MTVILEKFTLKALQMRLQNVEESFSHSYRKVKNPKLVVWTASDLIAWLMSQQAHCCLRLRPGSMRGCLLSSNYIISSSTVRFCAPLHLNRPHRSAFLTERKTTRKQTNQNSVACLSVLSLTLTKKTE